MQYFPALVRMFMAHPHRWALGISRLWVRRPLISAVECGTASAWLACYTPRVARRAK